MALLYFACLVATASLGLVSGTDPYGPSYGPAPPPPEYTIDFAKELITNLQLQANELAQDVASGQTLASVVEQRLSVTRTEGFAPLRNADTQQQEYVDLLAQKVKDLQYRANVAAGEVDGLQEVADGTNEGNNEVSGRLSGVEDDNAAQDVVIDDLEQKLSEHKQSTLDRIYSSIDYLNVKIFDVKRKIAIVQGAVEERVCEYGYVAVPVGGKDGVEKRIQFKTRFPSLPSIAISTVGFATHLDSQTYGYDDRDILYFDKFGLGDVTVEGFSLFSKDISSGIPDIKYVYCRYMACSGLAEDVVLPPHDDQLPV